MLNKHVKELAKGIFSCFFLSAPAWEGVDDPITCGDSIASELQILRGSWPGRPNAKYGLLRQRS
jgi:hypothetical protein